MRVLVAGGAGLIGSHIVTALRRAGHEPELLLPGAHPAAPDPEILSAEFLHADVGDARSVAAAVRGITGTAPRAAETTAGPRRLPPSPLPETCRRTGPHPPSGRDRGEGGRWN
ncbi:NAD-dependent epimerase/dehydratase family protein [Streptomyces sp. NPDC006553]|uniref:NAD-dependent epimerase/dehydratase family protein n=1 Tax=Streptomyces sp. NPDC006553 TaxID=3157180 RepID=UPI0033A04490